MAVVLILGVVGTLVLAVLWSDLLQGGDPDEDPGPGEDDPAPVATPEPLSFYEFALTGNWSHEITSENATEFYVFNEDRTGCYFKVGASGEVLAFRSLDDWELRDIDGDPDSFELWVSDPNDDNLLWRGVFHWEPFEYWDAGLQSSLYKPTETQRTCQDP